jgi:hypothetical protein
MTQHPEDSHCHQNQLLIQHKNDGKIYSSKHVINITQETKSPNSIAMSTVTTSIRKYYSVRPKTP